MEQKKKNLVKKMIIMMVIAIILMIALIIGRKFFILNTIYEKMQTYEAETNFYKKTIHYSGTSTIVEEVYRKGDKQYEKDTSLQSEYTERKYKNGEKIISWKEQEDRKIATIRKATMEEKTKLTDTAISHNFWNRVIMTMQCSIKTEECNGVACYLIDYGENYKEWIDKETGLLVRKSNGIYINGDGEEYNSLTDYKYSIGVVTEEQVKEPDLTGFEIREIE